MNCWASMHSFDSKPGFSCFEFAASSSEQVWLVGDFNGWGRLPLPMRFQNDRWVLRVQLQAGDYNYAFQLRDGYYAGGMIDIPLHFGQMSNEWMQQAAHTCTCGKHFWKWNWVVCL